MGWIGINRDIINYSIYKDHGAMRVLLHLLLTVNYSAVEWQSITIDRGETVTSLKRLSEELGMSKNTLLKSLSTLESAGEVSKRTTNKYTLIRVVNYNYWTHMFVSDSENNKNSGSKNEPQDNDCGSKNEPSRFKNCTTAVQKMNRCGSKNEHNNTKYKKYKNNTKKHSQDAERPSEREMCDFLKSKGFGEEVAKAAFLACDSFGFEKIGNWKAFSLKVAQTKKAEIKPLPTKPRRKKEHEYVSDEDVAELRKLMEGWDGEIKPLVKQSD